MTVRGPIAITGTITVSLDGVPLRTGLWAPRKGEMELKVLVPAGTTKGIHTITVSYGGSSTVLSSTTSFDVRVV